MPKILHRLDALQIERATIADSPLHDGGGLYLQITATGAKSWYFRYTLDGRAREMGLGGLTSITLKKARQLAAEARELKAQAIDPLEHKRAQRAARIVQAAKAVPFEAEAESYIKAYQSGWKNPDKAAGQWRQSLRDYAYPTIGAVSVGDVDTHMVVKLLEPIWSTKTETASRVRGRIEKILDRAAIKGHRSGPNPARWRGHLDAVFPARSKVAPVQHHPALPYPQIPAFMAELRRQNGTAARALEVVILCVLRTADVIEGVRREVDRTAKIWTLPKARTKTRELKVPLVPRALDLLPISHPGGGDLYLFEGDKPGEPLSNNAMLALLERMGRSDITVHGFRSTFKDWASDMTDFADMVSEMALAHAVGDQTEEAYRRGDLFQKRRRLMEAWADYCLAAPKVEVIPMRGVRKA